jgi:ribA/ribD-fused uncharacterized protein
VLFDGERVGRPTGAILAEISSFQGEWFFLNNYFPAPVELDGMMYPSVEHAYQAAKTFDAEARIRIQATASPDDAKILGRASVHRADWESVKLDLMRKLVHEKFRDKELRERLLRTGDALLIEGNDWGDTYWGRCNGKGENHMGQILMEIRDALA